MNSNQSNVFCQLFLQMPPGPFPPLENQLTAFLTRAMLKPVHLLLTGATGYIGLRLVPDLLEAGHRVTALVRDRRRFPADEFSEAGDRLQVLEGDFLLPDSLPDLPTDLDAAYYLLHSMGGGGDFVSREKTVAENFVNALAPTACQRIIYLGGLIDDDADLSPQDQRATHPLCRDETPRRSVARNRSPQRRAPPSVPRASSAASTGSPFSPPTGSCSPAWPRPSPARTEPARRSSLARHIEG